MIIFGRGWSLTQTGHRPGVEQYAEIERYWYRLPEHEIGNVACDEGSKKEVIEQTRTRDKIEPCHYLIAFEQENKLCKIVLGQ